MSKDLKTKISESEFYEIQTVCFDKNIGWDNSGLIAKNYFDDCNFIYYRHKSNSIQYGIHEYNFKADVAEEVRATDFIKMIKNIK